MDGTLDDLLKRLDACTTRSELQGVLAGLAAAQGFAGVLCIPARLGSAAAIADQPAALIAPSLPDALAALGDRSPEANPLLRRAAGALLAVDFAYTLNGQEAQGLAVPVHGPGGRFLLFALWRLGGAAMRRGAARPRRDFDSVARHVFLKLWNGGHGNPAPTLKPMEVACLTWAARGRTSAEIGVLLGVGERNAYYFLANGARRLGALSRCHAVALAMKRGLIDP